MTPKDAVIQAVQQLTAALKGNFATSKDEKEIYQLNKLDAILNPTVKKFGQR